jgi:hypothetical protein
MTLQVGASRRSLSIDTWAMLLHLTKVTSLIMILLVITILIILNKSGITYNDISYNVIIYNDITFNGITYNGITINDITFNDITYNNITYDITYSLNKFNFTYFFIYCYSLRHLLVKLVMPLK